MSSAPIHFVGHHVEITPALRDLATKKLERLHKRGDHITRIAVTFSVEKMRQQAKATLHVKDAEIHASAEDMDMYVAIDSLVDKLEKQISKHRQKLTDHHHHTNHHEEDEA